MRLVCSLGGGSAYGIEVTWGQVMDLSPGVQCGELCLPCSAFASLAASSWVAGGARHVLAEPVDAVKWARWLGQAIPA